MGKIGIGKFSYFNFYEEGRLKLSKHFSIFVASRPEFSFSLFFLKLIKSQFLAMHVPICIAPKLHFPNSLIDMTM